MLSPEAKLNRIYTNIQTNNVNLSESKVISNIREIFPEIFENVVVDSLDDMLNMIRDYVINNNVDVNNNNYNLN